MINKIDKARTEKGEQETVIVITPSTKTASLYTCVPSTINLAYKLTENPEVEILADDQYGIRIKLPSKWIKVSKPRKVEYTEEQKEALRKRMAEARGRKGEKRNGQST